MDETDLPSPPASDGDGGVPTVSRRALLATVGAGLASATLAACGGRSRRRPAPTVAPRPTTTTTPLTIRIGYVTEVTGANAFRGEMVTASLDAFQGYLDDKQGGTYKGVRAELIPADAPTGADGPAAYAELLGRHVDAVLWCTPYGLAETVPPITAGTLPVISVFADAAGGVDAAQLPLTGSAAKGSPLFQTMLPDQLALDLMFAYANEDRGFSTAGLIFDSAAYPRADALFASAAARHGITSRGVFSFDSRAAHIDLGPPLQALKRAGVHAVVCYALADHASIVATQLDTLDAKYVNTPAALLSHFKPMLMGPVWGTGDPAFAGLAGGAAAKGTLSVTALADVLTLPSWPIRKWIQDYVPRYNNGAVRGGENAPADAVAVLIDAAVRAGSTRGAALVEALESGQVTTWASSVGVAFGPDRHLAVTTDDAALLTLEFPPDPYNLGAEWRDVLPGGYQGPTHLVDFTLAANTRAHPDVMAGILQRRYGTSATDSYQGGDPTKVALCKAVH